MRLEVHVAGGIEGPADLHEYAERRVRFALGRFTDRIGLVKVNVAEVASPGGLVEKQCSIRVQVLPAAMIITQEARSSNVYAAVDNAIHGIGRSFNRYLERRGAPESPSSPKPPRVA